MLSVDGDRVERLAADEARGFGDRWLVLVDRFCAVDADDSEGAGSCQYNECSSATPCS